MTGTRRAYSGPVVGVIANPVSARDIRRVIANATALQIADRANIVLRVLACLRACGVGRVVMMPENGGIRHHVRKGIERARSQDPDTFPELSFLDMKVGGTVNDTRLAAAAMEAMGVATIVVLGGDGTHRAVVAACGKTPIAGISTGTNNAFPEHREPTITGLAVGLAVSGRVPKRLAFVPNKRLVVCKNRESDIALVDVAVVTERYAGARALWRTETFRELLVTFADPEVIGLSAIAGLVKPVGRQDRHGLHMKLGGAREAKFTIETPIAPGFIRGIGIRDFARLAPGRPVRPELSEGSIALDGEREISFSRHDDISVTLETDAFRTVNVKACMLYAAKRGLLRATPAGIARKVAA